MTLHETVEAESAAPVCPGCGVERAENAAFCHACGLALGHEEEATDAGVSESHSSAEFEGLDMVAEEPLDGAALRLVEDDATEVVAAVVVESPGPELAPEELGTADVVEDDAEDVTAIAPAASPFWTRRRVLFSTLSLVLVAALATAAVVVLTRGDGVDLEAGLATSAAATVEAVEQVAEAENLEELSEAGAAAAEASDSLDAVRQQFAPAEASAKSVAAKELVVAQQDVLEQFARLEGIGIDDTPGFEALESSLERPLRELEQANAAAVAAGLVPSKIEVDSVNDSADSADKIVSAAASALAKWGTDTAGARTAKDNEKAALESYEASIRPQFAAYNALRDDLASFIRRVDSGAYVSFSEAHEAFAVAKTKRQAVRAALVAAPPPESVSTVHAGLVGVIDRSIDALESGAEGLRQYEHDYYSYATYKDTPGWRTFSSRSDRIGTEWPAALEAWEARLGEENARVAAIELPPKPKL